jgi:hypothetical protein
LIFRGHFAFGNQLRKDIGILKVRSQRSDVVRHERLARLRSKKFVVLANLNCQENDTANNSNVGNKRQPVIDFGTIHIRFGDLIGSRFGSVAVILAENQWPAANQPLHADSGQRLLSANGGRCHYL